jgi:DNA repair ATPase RecN
LQGISGENDACYIKSVFGQTAPSGGTAVFIDANHKLGTMTSSRRFKEDINPMNNASDALFALNPVTFHYKKDIDPTATSQFGLVAEDVEKVNRDLVAHDKDGKPYSVRYEQVNAMLLDEFLKEHKKVQEQQATIAELKSNLENLAATVKQQASELKDVRMQLQIECSASVAANNR